MANRTTWRPAPGGVGGGEVAGTGFGGSFTNWYRRRRAAMRCRANRAPKYGRIEQSKSDSFSGRRRPKAISTKLSDDHIKNLLCVGRFEKGAP